MGGGLNAALNAGRTSLQTNQKAIEITGLNVANVNTEGYSRQSPNLTPYPSLNFGDFFIGTGVQVGSVGRSHDVFLAGQITDKSAEVGLENSMSSPLSELERVLGIGDGSLSDQFDDFFDSWRQLSTNPSGEVERQAVLQQGESIGNSFTSVYNETQQVVKNINTTLVSKIDGLNLALDEVADLNSRISAIEMSGQDANSDRDRRDLLLNSICETIGARSFETSSGTMSVQLPNGMPLVEGNMANHIVGVYSGTDVNIELEVGTTNIDLGRNAMGGEFRGLYEVRDVIIPDVVNRLDQLAYTFATEVNAAHNAGTDLNGNAGEDFFYQPVDQLDASASLTMNITSTSQIAAGSSPGSLVSQGYDDAAALEFGTGNIVVDINGVLTTVVIDDSVLGAENNSVTGVAAALNGIAGITATVNPNDNTLVVTPANHDDVVTIDSSSLVGGTYSLPSFTSVDLTPGDNTNVLSLLQLEQDTLSGLGGNDTFVSFYGKIAATIGIETARNLQAQEGYTDSLDQLQNLRDGIDGVSLEEEMINLMQYQKGFEASAKFLATVDEMMATLLTIKR